MSDISNSPKLNQLLGDGFCIFPNVLDSEILNELRQVTDDLLAKYPENDAEYFKYQGSNISVAYQHPVFARLFSYPKAMEALKELGFDDPKWWCSFLLSKPAYAPALYWHQDWWVWDDPISARDVPAQLFLMYYLTDTNPENGCLKVIPGTHRKRIPLHDQLPPAHTDETYNAPKDSVIFAPHPDEVDVTVKAGDLVVGDSRVLHAAYANSTPNKRSLLTLWYLPDYENVSDQIKSSVGRRGKPALPDWWEGEEGILMENRVPYYNGDAEPAVFNRVPGEHLG